MYSWVMALLQKFTWHKMYYYKFLRNEKLKLWWKFEILLNKWWKMECKRWHMTLYHDKYQAHLYRGCLPSCMHNLNSLWLNASWLHSLRTAVAVVGCWLLQHSLIVLSYLEIML